MPDAPAPGRGTDPSPPLVDDADPGGELGAAAEAAPSAAVQSGATGGTAPEIAQAGAAEAAAPGVGERTTFRLATFGAVLVVVLFAGYGLGRLNNGTASAAAPPVGGATVGGTMPGMPGMVVDENQPHTHNADGTVAQPGTAAPMGAVVGGLSLSSGGLTLAPASTTFVAGRPQRLGFRITAAGGIPVTTYAIVHDKPLHLIVIRRDLSGFQHLHPVMAPDGTWSIDLALAEPGIYRMIADFTAVVGGKPVATTLGTDLTVAGDYVPRALPAPARAVSTDGFDVGYEGTPSTASSQPILISVTPGVLEPYLGAYGHLVVLRQGDLAYVHVHPEPQLVDGKVKFWLALPSGGTYRMFFDFQVAGAVHTAAWTAQVS